MGEQWEYTVAELAYADGYGAVNAYVVRWVNGQELVDWKRNPHWSHYMNWAGEQGWECIGTGHTSYTASERQFLLFKRRKPQLKVAPPDTGRSLRNFT